MENKSQKNWIILIVGMIVIGTIAYMATQPMNRYMVAAAQGSGFSRTYVSMFGGIDKDTRVNGQTPIQYSIMSLGKLSEQKKEKLIPVIDMYLAKGVDINAPSAYGMTALHYAIAAEDPIAAAMLIEKKAVVNQPAHFESIEDNKDILNNIEGQTPLKFLVQRKKLKKIKDQAKIDQIEKMLRDAGANE